MVKHPLEETLAMALPEMEPIMALSMTVALAGPPTVFLVTEEAPPGG
ncbi:hypothetical protein MASR1M66_23280 [Aminivibrio sp.]